jgi:alpha-L-rhamnosidase
MAHVAPVALTCEYLVDPLGLDTPAPRMSWQLDGAHRGARQTAYQVRVSSAGGVRWDSGKVASDETLHIAYAGAPLRSRERLHWTVRVWDEHDEASDESAPATFEMAFLDRADWTATWIGADEAISAPLLRRDFTVEKPLQEARVYLCGLGYYELRLNGAKVGDRLLDPNWTNYDTREINGLLYPFDDQSTQRALYVTYDVTAALCTGTNTLGVILGNGWHNQRERTIEGLMWYGPPRLLLQCELRYEDGTAETIVSDTAWQTAEGPILFNNLFVGEVYDARRELPGWDAPGFDASAWAPARPAKPVEGPLLAQVSPPDRLQREIVPRLHAEPSPGVYVFDYGEVFSGWVRLRVDGPAGTTVTLRFSEEVFPDGTIDTTSTTGEFCEEQIQRDTFTGKGGAEAWEPRFTWHAFRYAEVTGFPGMPVPEDVIGRVVHADVPAAGDFACSNPLLNEIQAMYRRTQLANVHGCVTSDCPHRERLGYTGDGQLITETSMFNFQAAPWFAKWLNDIGDAQNHLTGFVPHTAPFYGGGGGPGWGAAYVIVAWHLYQHYGDRRALEAHYAGMAHWVEYLATRCDERGLVVREEPKSWCLGDWSLPGEFVIGTEVPIPPDLVNTAYYGFCAQLMARVATALGKADDAARYTALAREIADNFHRAYFDAERGCYSVGAFGTEAFALLLDAVPAAERARVIRHMVEHYAARGYTVDTGIMGTPAIFDALVLAGHAEEAYKLAAQTEYPSYGYMLAQGATTIWENWKQEIGSHCHPMYGGISGWFYRVLAGIQLHPDAPAYRRVMVAPHVVGDLTWARATVTTLRGPLAVAWEKGDAYTLSVTIPYGATAAVHLPAGRVTEGDALLWDGDFLKVSGITGVTATGEGLVVEITGGSYRFTVVP